MNNYLLENFRNVDINEKNVRSISIFPSGNFISISGSNSIKILDLHFNYYNILNQNLIISYVVKI